MLVGERAWRLVRHAVDRRAASRARRSSACSTDAEAVVRRLETPLVGREDELAEIVRRPSSARAATAGAHSSRCSARPAWGRRVSRARRSTLSGAATCVIGRTPASGEASTYAPLRDAFSALAGGSVGPWAAAILAGERDGDVVAARIAAAAGEAPSTGPVEETAWAGRRLLETLARERPVVLVLEDLHWAAPAFLDLVEHVAELARAPILLLGLARPELLDTRPQWAGGRLNASSILLDALPSDQAGVLLDRLDADTALDDENRAAILARAAGNPLFLEQLLASALEGDDRRAGLDPRVALGAARPASRGRAPSRPGCRRVRTRRSRPRSCRRSSTSTCARHSSTLARRDFVEPDGARRRSATRCGGSGTRSSATRPTPASRSAGARRCIEQIAAHRRRPRGAGGASKPTS